MRIDEPDFHSLGKTGLHSEDELNKKIMITGRTIEVINFISRPNRFSHAGFLAEDEDIISVLNGFYEGHTDYRCDPNAIVFIFGLKSLEEIDNVSEGDLYHALTNHYVSK